MPGATGMDADRRALHEAPLRHEGRSIREGRDAHIAPWITRARAGGRFVKRPYGADGTLARIGGGQAPRVGRDAHIAPWIMHARARSGRPKVAPTARTGRRRGSAGNRHPA